ncbi:hypothetical protein UlMin_004729 [Ulmus minor]
MKPPSFEGSTNPLDAEEWLSSMETILDFMELDDRERIICAAFMLKREARYWWESVKARRNVRTMLWADFVYEFNKKFFNPTALSAQQTEFLSLKQDNMTVAEAVKKFERLAKLCPYLVPTEEQRTKRMLEMFQPDISLAIECGGEPPATTTDCIERAYRAEHRLNQLREMRQRQFENRKKQGNQGGNQNIGNRNKGQQGSQSQGQGKNDNKRKGNNQAGRNTRQQTAKKNNATYPTCSKCGKNHLGECRLGTSVCYKCGKEGHFAKGCTARTPNDSRQNRNQGAQLKSLQVLTGGFTDDQDRKDVLEPNAKIYAYTKGDAEAGGSKVVTGQLPVANKIAHVLFDYGATHSFISAVFADCLGRNKDSIRQTFRTALPSDDVMLSNYW